MRTAAAVPACTQRHALQLLLQRTPVRLRNTSSGTAVSTSGAAEQAGVSATKMPSEK